MSGRTIYSYVGGNPVGYIDPFGLDKVIKYQEGGDKSKTYGATITVTDTTTGETIHVSQGSTLPNSQTQHNTVATGTYDGTNTTRKSGKPGIHIGETPTTSGSPSQTATDIFVHCGSTSTNRGSRGCLTVEPSRCEDFFRLFGREEPVTVQVGR